jgi:protein phosphatase
VQGLSEGVFFLRLEFASLSDIGQVRMKNEDAVGHYCPDDEKRLAERGAIFVVADGMGGHQGGEIASRLAVETVVSLYYALEGSDPAAILGECYAEANKEIFRKATSDADLFGMGTTCTTMVVRSTDDNGRSEHRGILRPRG